jgi:hypothetical protein
MHNILSCNGWADKFYLHYNIFIYIRSLTDCGASLCVIYKPCEWEGPGPIGDYCAKTNKQTELPIEFFVPRLGIIGLKYG